MFNDLVNEFENNKGKECSICGKEATHKCSEAVGDLSCDMGLCDDLVCIYVHNLVKHPQKHALLKKCESKIDYNVRLKALNKELRNLVEILNDYKFNLNKFEAVEPVRNMFADLITGKEAEIKRVEYKIQEIAKENKIMKYL